MAAMVAATAGVIPAAGISATIITAISFTSGITATSGTSSGASRPAWYGRGKAGPTCAALPARAIWPVFPAGMLRYSVGMAKPPSRPTDVFSALPAELSSRLFARARIVSLSADETLFLSGDTGDGCYLVDEGLLKASIISPAGGERILAIFGVGAVIGELSMIDGAPRSASVTALRDARLQFVSRVSFEAFGADSPDVYKHLVALLAGRLRDTNGALMATSFLSVRGRVARALLNLAEAFGHDVGNGRILVRQKVTQSDLAAMAGIARENVSRVLQDWMKRKVVSRLAGYYCIEDKRSLTGEVEG
jgi:CRP/FNR family cyclic AMP-dependent transcriptional regulator